KEYEHEPIASTAFAILHPFAGVINRYIYFYLRSPSFVRFVESTMKGVAYPAINDGDFFQGYFPLPPLPEQHRIVAKIDQLMARCDALEKLRADRDQKRLVVHAAAIRQLLDPASLPSRPQHVQPFLFSHFPELYTVKENVAELRKAILQLAVMGKLVKQDPNDPPASELLKQIEAEKKRLVIEDVYRSNEDKAENIGTPAFMLPVKWEWTTIQQLGFILGGKRLPKGHSYSETPTKYRYLTVTNMKDGTIVDNDVKYISQSTYNEIKRYIISKNDIYITIAGTIGVVGTIPEEYDGMNLTENASRFVLFKCDKRFLVFLLSSRMVQDQFAVMTNKMAQPKLSLRSILSTGIPLPPLAEQHRIVAKIDQLMALCDAMENQITCATDKQNALLEALLKGV
ncbi:MAG: restriction endonuclease subunit S, partial [bacterium]